MASDWLTANVKTRDRDPGIISLVRVSQGLWKARCVEFLGPGARFSKAPKIFRARKAIFSSSVS